MHAAQQLRIGFAASLFASRWYNTVKDKVSTALQNRLGIAVAERWDALLARLAARRAEPSATSRATASAS